MDGAPIFSRDLTRAPHGETPGQRALPQPWAVSSRMAETPNGDYRRAGTS